MRPTTEQLDAAIETVIATLKSVFHDQINDIDPRDSVRPQFAILCTSDPITGKPFEKVALVIMRPSEWATEEDKDKVADLVRLIAVAGDAAAVAFCFDTWIVTGDAAQDCATRNIPAREHLLRKEALMCAIERTDRPPHVEHHIYRRTSDGELVWQDSERGPSDGVTMTGRFAELLPPRRPTPRERGAAQMLVAMGAAGKLTWREIK